MKKRRFLPAIICALMILCMMPGDVQAATGAVTSVQQVTGLKKNTVTNTSINISWSQVTGASGYEVYRSNAINGSYKKIKTVAAGNSAFCNQKLTAGTEYYYKVRAYKTVGTSSVYGKYSKVLTAYTKSVSTQKATTRCNVNLRKHAGTNYARVTLIPAGTSVSILAQTKEKSGASWYHVSFKANGKTVSGYLRADLVTTSKVSTKKATGTVSVLALRVRKGAGTSTAKIDTIFYGQKVTILSTKTANDGSSWYHISFTKNGKTIKGYVAAKYIKKK